MYSRPSGSRFTCSITAVVPTLDGSRSVPVSRPLRSRHTPNGRPPAMHSLMSWRYRSSNTCSRSAAPGTSTVFKGKRPSVVCMPRYFSAPQRLRLVSELLLPGLRDLLECVLVDFFRIVFEIVELGHQTEKLWHGNLFRVLIRIRLRELETDVLDILPSQPHCHHLLTCEGRIVGQGGGNNLRQTMPMML